MSEEAIRIPSAGAVFWAEALPDGSGGVRAIAGPPPSLQVTLSGALPSGITADTGSRGLVLLSSPILYDHLPTQAELATVPSLPPITVSGATQSLDGRFHPRLFSVYADTGRADIRARCVRAFRRRASARPVPSC